MYPYSYIIPDSLIVKTIFLALGQMKVFINRYFKYSLNFEKRKNHKLRISPKLTVK